MRNRNLKNTLKLYAVAGTQTVLLGFDIPKSNVIGKGFMGFKVERTDSKGKTTLLNGMKRFASDDLKNPKQTLSPIQSYYWKDYTADPNCEYTYSVEALFGTWNSMKPAFKAKIKITTEPLHSGEQSVYFNYGVTGSQAYARKFGNIAPKKQPTKKKEMAAYDFLGRELWRDGLLTFVEQAKSKKHKLCCAFYEIEYPPFLEALAHARKRGAEIEIVYSAQTNQKKHNEEALKKAGLFDVSHPRTIVSQPHNKFMILCDGGTPKQVWTGSTNITVRGIFGHSNTGHWIVDEAIAKKYSFYWELLKTNPAGKDMKERTEKIQPDLDAANIKKGTSIIFSPRTSDRMLKTYVDMMRGAEQAMCVIYPFNIEKIFKDFYAEDQEYLRFIITDKSGEKTDFVTNDRDVVRTCGAVLNRSEGRWAREITSKTTTQASTLYVHNKFFIVDPLGSNPLVVTGSANFSDESLKKNDENTLIIKGNKRVADIYFTEFARMFDHFLPRYLHEIQKNKPNAPKRGFSKPLDESGAWVDDYYDPNTLGCKRRLLFVKMAV